jgi:hypothetical protein
MTAPPEDRSKEEAVSVCEHCAAGWVFEDAQKWERARQFDSDYYGPIERGEWRLEKCVVRHGYHYVGRKYMEAL